MMKTMPKLAAIWAACLICTFLTASSCSQTPEQRDPDPATTDPNGTSDPNAAISQPTDPNAAVAVEPEKVDGTEPIVGEESLPTAGTAGNGEANPGTAEVGGTGEATPEETTPETVEAPPVPVVPPTIIHVGLPEFGTPEWDQVLKDTPIERIVEFLEAKAASTGLPADRMTALGALVGKASGAGHSTSPELLRAHDALDMLKLVPEVDPQFIKMQQAQVHSLIGNATESLKAINEAKKKTLELMPPELAPMWFTTAERKLDENGEYEMRKLTNGAINDVYRPDESIYVAQRFRYLSGKEQVTTGKYIYSIRVTAELFDEKNERVKDFSWGPKDLSIPRGLPPEQWETAYQQIRLPHSIKAEHDYTLRVTITDLFDLGKESVSGSISVKVRNR